MKTYIYANSEVIAQHDGDNKDDIYFYLHDRLGSVRLVVDNTGAVKNSYTYNPFGEVFLRRSQMLKKIFNHERIGTIMKPFYLKIAGCVTTHCGHN